MVPVVYRCSRCGYILYIHWRVGQSSYGVPTPSGLSSWYGGVCPRCGHRLGRPGLQDLSVIADRDLVKMRVELLERLLEEQRRPRLSRHVPVRSAREVAVNA